jgi:hypothetical protein
MLEGLVQKIYDLKKREFIYKRSEAGALATHFSRLADPDLGSAVKSYRDTQVAKAHLPSKLWNT